MRRADGLPGVIAHRGASGYRLEHTLTSYLLAIEMGCDYIEPDVVSTLDGVLVVRHENEISGTTDVASRPEFADRRTTKIVDGTPHSGWFTEDFLAEELLSLHTVERLPQLRPDHCVYDGRHGIATLDDVLVMLGEVNARRQEPVGVYIETKHPTYFRDIGLGLDDALVDTLERHGWNEPDSKTVIQSYEVSNLQYLRDKTPVPLIQLFDLTGAPYDFVATLDPRTYETLATQEGLARVAEYAQGIGPHKSLVVPRDEHRRLLPPTSLVDDAHTQGLEVHIWTMRNENNFLPADFRTSDDVAEHGDAAAEYRVFFEAGVDAVFSDFTDTAIAARTAWAARRSGVPPAETEDLSVVRP